LSRALSNSAGKGPLPGDSLSIKFSSGHAGRPPVQGGLKGSISISNKSAKKSKQKRRPENAVAIMRYNYKLKGKISPFKRTAESLKFLLSLDPGPTKGEKEGIYCRAG
jgi:hypothetical protein